MAISQALARKIAEAKTTGGGNNIKDGNYVLVTRRLMCEQKFKGTCFIGEFDVVEAEKTHATVEPNAIGSDCSFVLNLDKNPETAYGNLKSFFLGFLGLDEATTSNDTLMAKIQEYTSEEQKARGMLVYCSTYRKVTQKGPNAGKEGVYPRWTAIDQTPTEVTERRKQLDADKK